MSYLKISLTHIFIIFCSAAFCQNPAAVTMRWKVPPGEVLSYKAYMKVDTAASDKSPFENFFKSVGFDSIGMGKSNSIEKSQSGKADKNNRAKNRARAGSGMREMVQRMRSMEPDYYTTSLTRGKPGLINVEMLPFKEKTKIDGTDKEDGFSKMFSAVASEPLLQAFIRDDGTLESFYLGSEQKNILTLFFQLPAKPVKVNDSLQVATNFVNVGRQFKCDTSYKKSKVWVANITDGPAGKVVTVKYDIEEYVAGGYNWPFSMREKEAAGNRMNTVFNTTFRATASFSIAEGKWLAYEGVMEVSNTGMMGMGHSRKWYRLVPQ